jgi:hypothetical protein
LVPQKHLKIGDEADVANAEESEDFEPSLLEMGQ